MSSGSHLSKELHDLIKSIGETRSKQEEDKIILSEQQRLKDKINEKNLSQRRQKENLIKGIYIDMLGHDASFAHIHAVNMTQSKQLPLKRLGYLCCCLFLGDNSELLILLVANLQRDLTSTNVHEVVIALTALTKLINQTIVNALQDQVLKLLIHTTDLVRKKAIMVLQRIWRLNPTLIPDYEEKMRRALCDKEPSVMGAALNLYYEQIKINASKFKETTGSFILILKQIIEHKLPREFDYHRMPAPWIQIKILQVLAMLGSNDLKVSEQIYEILGQALRRSDDTGINIGHAVTYQCVKTIATIYPNQHLLEMAASSVSKFLTAENNNLKYLGINALIQIVSIEPKYVLEHQLTIVDCLESKDETLKRETLELLFKMTNSQNIITIVDKLIFFLKSAQDQHFRKDLVNKICSLSERFAPNQEWFLQTMNQVFEFGAEFIDNQILNNFLKLLNENFQLEGQEFGKYIIDQYINTIQKANQSDITIKMISWVIGEIGSSIYSNNVEKISELVEILLTTITNEFEDSSTRAWVLNALAKLSSCPAFEMNDQANACFDYYKNSKYLDLFKRSNDYIILQKYNAALRQSQLVVFDDKLSFLDTFIDTARLQGAKDYDQAKSMKAALGIAASNDNTTSLYFEPKASDKLVSLRPVNNQEEPVVQFKGEVKWNPEGYHEAKKEEVPKFYTENKQSISSEDYNKGKSGYGSQSGGGGVQVYRAGSEKDDKNYQPQQPPKQQQQVEDPNKKEKEALMNSIFSSVSNQPTQKPTYGQYKATTQETTQAVTQNNPQKNQQDLLGFDMGDNQPQKQPQTNKPGPPKFGSKAGNPPTFGAKAKQTAPQQQSQQQPQPQQKINEQLTNYPEPFLKPFPEQQPLPQQPQQPPLQQQQQTVLFQDPPKQQQPTLFGAQKQQQIQNIQNQKRFQPLNIDVDQYETYWEQLSIEKQETFQSKIKSENDFRRMLQFLGIGSVEIIGTEMICAGKNINNQLVVLLYGIYNPSGKLEITLKSNSNDDISFVLSTIKQQF